MTTKKAGKNSEAEQFKLTGVTVGVLQEDWTP